MALKIREIARYIELERKKIALRFQSIIGPSDVRIELKAIEENLELLKRKLDLAHFDKLCIPNQMEIEKLENELFSKQNLKDLVSAKDIETLKLFERRNKLVRAVIENRFEIAKLLFLAAKLPDAIQEPLFKQIMARDGKTYLKLDIESEIAKKLALYLNRLGISCLAQKDALIFSSDHKTDFNERPLPLQNRNIFLDKKELEKYEKNKKELDKTIVQIQIKTAERQIKIFSFDEETEFANLQKKYLTHLKEQDEILKEFISEED